MAGVVGTEQSAIGQRRSESWLYDSRYHSQGLLDGLNSSLPSTSWEPQKGGKEERDERNEGRRRYSDFDGGDGPRYG